jgi:anthranilate synthase/aminodeoxychorismate synthase-like glutamine amidotransferase
MQPILIDHDDSFTYILAQYIGEITGEFPKVLHHAQTSLEEIKAYKPSHIILSPGPGTAENPKDFAIGPDLIMAFPQTPILGVCLGHQGLAAHFGAKITPAAKVMHGKRSQITHTGTSIFKDLPNPLTVMRYHSLSVTLPKDCEALAWSEDQTLMAFKHKSRPLYGLQFHPESVGTEHGKKILESFLSTRAL